MFDLLMFDLDGTLVDSRFDIADAVNVVLRSRGLRTVTDTQVRGWIGTGARETVIHALAQVDGRGVDAWRANEADIDEAMEQFSKAYIKCCGMRSRLYPHVFTTLCKLRHRPVALALVTNTPNRLTDRALGAYGLRPFFDPVVGGDTLTEPKPSPLPLRYCMKVHGVAPERALMIGDSPVDVAAARAAGVTCWSVPYGYSGNRPIGEAGPNRVLAGFADVLQAVARRDAKKIFASRGRCPIPNPIIAAPGDLHGTDLPATVRSSCKPRQACANMPASRFRGIGF